MIKEEITYRNLDDVEVTETHYFHMNEAEVLEFQASLGSDDPTVILERLARSKDYATVLDLVKRLVIMTYGFRDGQRFVKDPELTKEFIETGAFSAFFVKCFQDADYLANFVMGALPRDASRRIAKNTEPTQATLPPPPPNTGSTASV